MNKKLITQFESEDGAKVEVFKFDSRTVIEITNGKEKKVDNEVKKEQSIVRYSKKQRVERILQLIEENKTREQVKRQMYEESYYSNNPNPASAFAGDWNSI